MYHQAQYGTVGADGVPVIPAPADWPFTDPSASVAPPASATASPRKRMYGRVKNSNEQSKQMDKSKDALTKEEKKKRKGAKKSGVSMRRHEGEYKDIISGMLVTDGVRLSQASAYEKGEATNKHGLKFCSQKAVEMYRNGTETDSDDE